MTSNLGTSEVGRQPVGFRTDGKGVLDEERLKASVQEALKRAFRPEFLNRVDEIIVFNTLTQDQIKQIVRLMAGEVQERLLGHKVTFDLSEAALEWLIKEGYDPVFGARPLRRALQRYIENPLAKKLLSGEFSEGNHIEVNVAKGQLTFSEV